MNTNKSTTEEISVKGFTPHPAQQKVIEAISKPSCKYFTLSTGRQFGKSILAENLMLLWLLNQPKMLGLYLTPTYKLGSKIYGEIIDAAPADLIQTYNKSELSIEFINGSKLLFGSAERADALRGFTLDYLVIDEAAFIKEEVFETILHPSVLVKGKKVLFISTPKGRNWFKKFFDKGNNPDEIYSSYSSFTAPSFSSPYISQEEIELYKQDKPEHIFKQEILAEFIDSDGLLFKNIDAAQTGTFAPPIEGEKYYAGIDLAQSVDFTVLTILDSKCNVVYRRRMSKISWNEIRRRLLEGLELYKPECLIELNNVGSVIYEDLKQHYQNIKPFVTSNKSKNIIIENLMYSFENKSIKYPSEFTQLTLELEAFEYSFTPNQRLIKYAAANGEHDDCVISLALAVEVYNRNSTKGQYSFISI